VNSVMIVVYETVEAGAVRVKASRREMPTRGSSGSVMRFTVVKEKDEVVNKFRQVATGTKVFRGPQRWFSLGTVVVVRV